MWLVSGKGARNQSVVAWHKADLCQWLCRVHMKTGLPSGTSFPNPTHHHLHTISSFHCTFNLDPSHLVKISSKLNLTSKAHFELLWKKTEHGQPAQINGPKRKFYQTITAINEYHCQQPEGSKTCHATEREQDNKRKVVN